MFTSVCIWSKPWKRHKMLRRMRAMSLWLQKQLLMSRFNTSSLTHWSSLTMSQRHSKSVQRTKCFRLRSPFPFRIRSRSSYLSNFYSHQYCIPHNRTSPSKAIMGIHKTDTCSHCCKLYRVEFRRESSSLCFRSAWSSPNTLGIDSRWCTRSNWLHMFRISSYRRMESD